MGEVRVKRVLEELIGPLDSWRQYFTAIGAISVANRLPDGAVVFWSAVAALDDGEVIRNPARDRLFEGVVKTLADDVLPAVMGSATALIRLHEENGAFETARTLRAARDVAARELEGRNRQWDA